MKQKHDYRRMRFLWNKGFSATYIANDQNTTPRYVYLIIERARARGDESWERKRG